MKTSIKIERLENKIKELQRELEDILRSQIEDYNPTVMNRGIMLND